MITQNSDYDLAGQVIGCAMEVHRELGHGFNEKVYKNALAIELRKQGFDVEVEKKIKVDYKGCLVGDFAADIIVKEELILELKAVENLCPAHEAQLVNYLKATNTVNGLLINFGAASLQFKKKFKEYQPKPTTPPKLQS
jgi:GxxExxY protein